MIPRIAAAVGLACITVLAIPAVSFAGTGTVSGGGTTATISIQDAVFDGNECLDVPFDVAFTSYADLYLAASLPGSSSAISVTVSTDDPGRMSSYFQVCPSDGAGTYAVRGTMEDYDDGDRDEYEPPVIQIPAGLQFTVSEASASFTGLTALQKGSVLRISGEVTAKTSRGSIGGGGTVTVMSMLPKSLGGDGKWITAGTTVLDQFGRFAVAKSTSKGLAGAWIRVSVTDSSWSGDATASTRVKRAS